MPCKSRKSSSSLLAPAFIWSVFSENLYVFYRRFYRKQIEQQSYFKLYFNRDMTWLILFDFL